MTMRLLEDAIASPIGLIRIAVDDSGALVALDFEDTRERMLRLLARRYRGFELAARDDPAGHGERVARYFAGDLGAFDDALLATGGSAFQQRAWRALRDIAPGRTATYGEQAARLGVPSAARAVGLANSLNPISIALPCHRVIGANRALTGYAGGLARKRWLLAHEAACVSAEAFRRAAYPRTPPPPADAPRSPRTSA